MTRLSTLVTTLRSPPKEWENPKPRWSMICNGTTCGQNIQWWFSGPTHTGRRSSALTGSSSLDSSLWVLTSLSTSSLTRLHTSTSMGTKTCVLPTSVNLPSSQTKFSYHTNSKGAVQLMPAPQVPAKVSVAKKTRGSELRPPLISPSAVNSTKQLDCRFTHKCSNCSSSSHSESTCT